MSHIYQARPVAEDELQEVPAPICLGGQKLFTALLWLPAQPQLPQSHILLVLDEWSSKLCDILCFARLLIRRVFSVSIKFIIIVALPN